MNKYYAHSQKEIVGFYCFISDKPKPELPSKKPQLNRWIEARIEAWKRFARATVQDYPQYA